MSIREFLKEKPRESDILAFLQQDNKDKNDYLDELRNDIDKAITQNRNNISIYNIQDQNLTNPLGHISQYKRDLYDYENNQEMNADDLSDYILDKQSQFNASKPIFADDNEVARKSNQFMRDLGDELQKSGRGKLLQDSDGSYWVKDVKGNYAKVQGSLIGDLYRGIRDNGASVALGTAGAIGGGMLGGGVGMVAGGALGASLGAGYDYYGNTKDTNQEANLKEALMLMGENAGLSLVGDAAFAGVAKGARALKNTYAMAKTGSAVGKDMIDGIAVKGNNLKENIGDRFRKISPNIINDLASQGSETSKAYAKELIESGNGNYDDILQKSRTIPLEVNQGNAFADFAAKKAQSMANMSKNNLVKNISQKSADVLNTISKNIGSKEAALNQQDLINLSFINGDLANMARSVLAKDPKISNKVANSLHLQDEAILKELNLNNTSKADELYALRDARAKRAYKEFGKGLDDLDRLSSNGITINKQVLVDAIDNSGIYTEATPAKVKEFIKEAMNGELDGKSVKEIYDRIDAIGKKLKDNSSYNYSGFLNGLKDVFLESIVESSNNKELSRNILEKIRSDYKAFKVYDKSKLGEKLKGSEKDISKDIDKIINETNPKKNYEAITKGLSDDEIEVLDSQIITRALEKNKINIGDTNNPKFIVNYKAFMDNFENYKPKSKSGQEKIEVLKTISDLRTNFETIIDGILNSKAKELGHGISPNFMERAKTMFVNNFTDYIAFYFMRLLEVGKRAGLRIQMRRGFANINTLQDFDKSAKEFISSIKDKTLKEEAQNARKEFNSKVKDLIKGDNFYMDKPDPKDSSLKFIGKNGKEYIIDKNARSEWMKTFNLKSIDDDYIPNIPKEVKMALKDREIKLTKGSLLKLVERDRIKYIPHIKDTLENPQVVLRDKDDFVFIKNIDSQTYFTSIGKDYETHLTIISNSPKKQNNIRNKMKNAKVVYYNNARALPTSRASSETKQVSFSNGNSTQDKPKENLIEKLKEDRKNKKSVKEKLDEKIKNQKESDENKWKRFDNFLKENKDYSLDVMGDLDVVTREFILNAKKKTHKGKKADIPDLMRSKIENELNIKPLKEFGKNYAEYYHDGKGALQKLLIEKQGQVAGAFHRKDLGDIDLVWGEVTDKIKHKGYGLAHIIDKHPDFYVKMIDEIVEKGEVKKSHNGFNIIYKDYRLGLNEGWNEKGQKIGNNKWVVTAFEKI
ncbi:PBECR2 nuclease fold domain-containing protein [Campylobacter sp. 1569]|uniref:putative barnase/colicin E5 family endoribonuclease n=1 Tax=Campylobacter sp. 1569 TaxID=2735746 RepID=UPI00301D71EE|nr:PBECR2 nuclease fold domain-containing protein [Campylobacter sp. 1569]